MDPESILRPPSESMDSLELSSSVQVLTLPEGIYAFTIDGVERIVAHSDRLNLPALQVGLAPVHSTGRVELLSKMATVDRWLIDRSDTIMVRIIGGDGTILLTSVRTPDSANLSVNVNRLNVASSVNQSDTEAPRDPNDYSSSISLQLLTHIQCLGDLDFEGGWAGWPGQRLWIEGFAVSSVDSLPPDFIEYCGILANGLQTPWHRSQELCGNSRRRNAVDGVLARLKPEVEEKFQCLYRGRFVSGNIIGPLDNGGVCTSRVPGDPLEAIEIRLVSRHDDSAQFS